jgi:hypothetical protein
MPALRESDLPLGRLRHKRQTVLNSQAVDLSKPQFPAKADELAPRRVQGAGIMAGAVVCLFLSRVLGLVTHDAPPLCK